MAATQRVWNILVDEIPYKVELMKNAVILNSGEPIKLNKLKKENSLFVETKYILPIEGKEVALYISQSSDVTLTIDEKVWDTGEVYEKKQMPKWCWVFAGLYILNFAFILGGALGGALNAGLFAITAGISADKQKSTGVRVLICTAIWFGAAVLELFLALLIVGIAM